jgi:PAS domain S-box-containing protein
MKSGKKTKGQLARELAQLRRRVGELEAAAIELRLAAGALQESEAKFRTLVEQIPRSLIYMASLDERSTTLYVSPQVEEILGYTQEEYKADPDLWGKILHPDDYDSVMAEVRRCHRTGERLTIEYRIIRKDDETIWVHDVANIVRDDHGKPLFLLGVNTNITKRKLTEEKLRRREEELEAKTRELEEVNSALRVLLKRADEDKREFERRIVSTVKALVAPSLEKLRQSASDVRQLAYVSMLESNLNDIISPFAQRLSSQHLGFTPAELQVASFVKEGKNTKEMAELLRLSTRTIESHRQSIRNKLGLKNRKANLRTHLIVAS